MGARRISDPHNPGIASLIFRAGLSEFVQRKYGREDRRVVEQRRAARILREAGVIDYDQYCDLRRKIDRRVVARTLIELRKQEPFAERVRFVRQMRQVAPVGVSAYAVKNGRRGLAVSAS